MFARAPFNLTEEKVPMYSVRSAVWQLWFAFIIIIIIIIINGSTTFCWALASLSLSLFFSFLIFFTQTVGLLGRGISPSQGRYLFKPGSSHVVFVVEEVALGQVFSEYFGFPCHSSFHQFLHNHHHLSIIWGWYNRPVVAAVPRDSVSPR
jgi:hypothetical protein